MIFKMHVFYRQIVCAHMVSSQSLWEEAEKAKALNKGHGTKCAMRGPLNRHSRENCTLGVEEWCKTT